MFALVGARLEIRFDGYARGVTATELGLPALRGAAHRDPARPADPRLVDSFGRVATDLRISLTDRCNLRCTYCMPAEGLDWMPRDEQLTDDELVRLITIAVRDLGVHELRFTGGEPLLRRGLEHIIAASADQRPRPDISLTTNGIGLARRAEALAAAGVDRLNVSLDTLRPDRFASITRRDRLSDVLAGLAAARAAGLDPVKINTVLLRGVNDDEAVPLLEFAVEQGFELRFIEQMPLDAQHGWQRAEMVTAGEIMETLALDVHAHARPDRARRRPGGAVARRRRARGGRRHRLGHPAVLRRLRPHAPHRRTGRSARASSPAPRPTCARCCAAARPTGRSPTPGATPCGASSRATGSTTPASCSRTAR